MHYCVCIILDMFILSQLASQLSLLSLASLSRDVGSQCARWKPASSTFNHTHHYLNLCLHQVNLSIHQLNLWLSVCSMEACLLDVQPHTVASVAAQHCASAADSGSGVSVRENGRSGRTGDRNVDLSSASKALELQGNVSESVREMVGNSPMCDFLSSPLTAQHLQCSSSTSSEKRVDSESNGPQFTGFTSTKVQILTPEETSEYGLARHGRHK
jgi:hypothetical protein